MPKSAARPRWTLAEITRLMEEDLDRSALSAEARRAAQFEPLTPAQTAEAFGGDPRFAVPAYRIPYFTLDGRRRTDMWRVRRLAAPEPVGFRGVQPATLKRRYTQPAGVPPAVYWPPVSPWRTGVIPNVNIPIIITEGEKKALRAAELKLPCIGLGGVWNFRSRKAGVALLPELAELNWKGRSAYIVYDNDIVTKIEVQRAQLALAEELTALGAGVRAVRLPPGAENKGLDDFLRRGAPALEELKALLDAAYELFPHRELIALNDEYAHVRRYNAVYSEHTGGFLTQPQLAHIALRSPPLPAVEDSDAPAAGKRGAKPKRVRLFDYWMSWPAARTVTDIVYAPGEPAHTDTGALNTWRGLALEPRRTTRAEMAPFLRYIGALLNDDPEHSRWVLQWLALPLQRPGERNFTALVLWSRHHGTGKSTLGYLMKDIYGANFTEITHEQLTAQYEYYVAGRQFVMINEAAGVERAKNIDEKLKNLIVAEELTVRAKYQPDRVVANTVNYLITSNRPDAVPVTVSDRRYAIFEVAHPALTAEFLRELNEGWRKARGGAAALAWWLINEVDLSDFNPTAPAPFTDAKAEMVTLGLADYEHFAHELVEAPARYLPDPATQLCTLERLTQLFLLRHNLNQGPPMRLVGAALRQAGAVARQITITDSAGAATRRRIWAVRNIEYWTRARTAAWEAEWRARPEPGTPEAAERAGAAPRAASFALDPTVYK